MNYWALIIAGIVKEITEESPEGRYHPSLLWIPCGPEVQQRWLYSSETGTFTPPQQEPEEA